MKAPFYLNIECRYIICLIVARTVFSFVEILRSIVVKFRADNDYVDVEILRWKPFVKTIPFLQSGKNTAIIQLATFIAESTEFRTIVAGLTIIVFFYINKIWMKLNFTYWTLVHILRHLVSRKSVGFVTLWVWNATCEGLVGRLCVTSASRPSVTSASPTRPSSLIHITNTTTITNTLLFTILDTYKCPPYLLVNSKIYIPLIFYQ